MPRIKDEKTGRFIKQYNTYTLNLEDEYGIYGIGYCSNTGREFYFDMDDYDKIKDYCWSEHKRGQVYFAPEARDINTGKLIKMHHLIVGKFFDHADKNPFNNRKYNLRPATETENIQNRRKRSDNKSGFIGVIWDKENYRWLAYIRINKKHKNLGRFVNKEDAVKARLNAEMKYFGEFAPQRHLFTEYEVVEDEI